MIAINVIIDDRTQSVIDAVARANLVGLQQITARVVEVARRSIQPASTTILDLKKGRAFKIVEHAKPGEPPRTKGLPGKNIRDAITSNSPSSFPEFIAATRATHVEHTTNVTIGTNTEEIGDIGRVMEFGGEYKGEHLAPHPYIGPAFDSVITDIAEPWDGSIGE